MHAGEAPASFCTRHCYETLYRTDSLHATIETPTAVSASDAQGARPLSMSLGSTAYSMSLGSKTFAIGTIAGL